MHYQTYIMSIRFIMYNVAITFNFFVFYVFLNTTQYTDLLLLHFLLFLLHNGLYS
jgi:hypothetical protein